MPRLLEVRGLSHVFKLGSVTLRAVDRVDLSLEEGETLGLVGESGSGKTTLARAILRLTEPTAGSIQFDGVDFKGLDEETLRRRRREIQMIFQDLAGSLDPRGTVAEILREPWVIQRIGTPHERGRWTDELLDAVVLDRSLAAARAVELSGGQQQRVVIARALALRPRLVVADEPVSALDASVGAQILNLLAELQRRYRLTLLLISHSLPVVHYLATRVSVMYLGRIVEEASAAEFFRAPRHPYSRALLEGARLPGEVASPAHPPPGCPFHPRCAQALSRCRQQAPALVSATESAKVACFLYNDATLPAYQGEISNPVLSR